MPIYEYRCKNCGHVTAFLEKLGAKKRHPCEKCGSHAGTSSSADSSCPTGTCSLPE